MEITSPNLYVNKCEEILKSNKKEIKDLKGTIMLQEKQLLESKIDTLSKTKELYISWSEAEEVEGHLKKRDQFLAHANVIQARITHLRAEWRSIQ